MPPDRFEEVAEPRVVPVPRPAGGCVPCAPPPTRLDTRRLSCGVSSDPTPLGRSVLARGVVGSCGSDLPSVCSVGDNLGVSTGVCLVLRRGLPPSSGGVHLPSGGVSGGGIWSEARLEGGGVRLWRFGGL
eukprot:Hpha_TRINITY_DN6570_c0_g1::TRINITY_DN6570_c0_g1_i1::g.45996::m.45996